MSKNSAVSSIASEIPDHLPNKVNTQSDEQTMSPQILEANSQKLDIQYMMDDAYSTYRIRDIHREAKLDVIENLPPNFVNELRAELYDYYYTTELYTGTMPERLDEESEKRYLRGRVFEFLVNNDPRIKQKSPATEEFLMLMQNPRRFPDKKDADRERNPDAAYIKANEDGSLTIEGVGEIKLGKLDRRSIQQLKAFPTSCKNICDDLNELKENKSPIKLRRKGLPSLANTRGNIDPGAPLVTMSKDFKEYVILPANRNIQRHPNEGDMAYKERLYTTLFADEFHGDKKMRNDFIAIADNLNIINSPFNTKDVAIISEYIYGEIQKKEASEN